MKDIRKVDYAIVRVKPDVSISYLQKGKRKVTWDAGTQLLASNDHSPENEYPVWIRVTKEGGYPIDPEEFDEKFEVHRELSEDEFRELEETLPGGFTDDPPVQNRHEFTRKDTRRELAQVWDPEGGQHGLYSVYARDYEVFETAVTAYFEDGVEGDLEEYCNKEYSIGVERVFVDYEVKS